MSVMVVLVSVVGVFLVKSLFGLDTDFEDKCLT